MSYLITECEQGDTEYIAGKLIEYNLTQVPPTQPFVFKEVSKKIVDENGIVIAGLNATIQAWNFTVINMLWVDSNHRKAGLGSMLLEHVESIAKEQGCYLVQLDTFDFQAKDFYVKHGYEIFGTLENCPAEHKWHFLKKYLI